MSEDDSHEKQIRSIATSLIKRHQRHIQDVIREREIAYYQGNGVFCPVCCNPFRAFAPVYRGRISGDQQEKIEVQAENARCPDCHSHQRHRLLWKYLHEKSQVFDGQRKSLLEIAPELPFFRKFSQLVYIQYNPCDKYPQQLKYADYPGMIFEADLCELPMPENHFDMILCSHVLEHVMDDQVALRELFRVLKPGGLLLIQAPVSYDLKSTLEDTGNSTAELREKLFGQHDHYRRYGADILEHIQQAGFAVTPFDCRENYTPAEITRFGLDPWEKIYQCTK